MAIASRAADAPAVAPPAGSNDRLARAVCALPDLVAIAVAGFALGPMALLLAGYFVPWLAFVLGVAGAAAALSCYRLPAVPDPGRTAWWTLIALGVAALWFGLNYGLAGQDLYAQRDPATYGLAGRWLMDHHSLRIPTHLNVFGSLPGLDLRSAGFDGDATAHVYAQGNHLLPVFLALAGTVLGAGAVLHANMAITALALLVFFGVARRVVGGPLAVVAVAALGASMPLLYVGRDTFSEPLALLLLMGGLGLLYRAIESRRTIDFGLAGLVAGASAMVRIDSYVSLLTLIVVAAVLAAIAPPRSRRAATRRSLALLGGAMPGAVLGWLDVTWLSPGYYHNQRVQLHPVMLFAGGLFVVGCVLVGVVWRLRVVSWLARPAVRHRLAWSACTALLVAFVVLVSRPLWLQSHGRGDYEILRAAQRAAGQPVDGTRQYAELTVTWQAMYLGWVAVGLAVLGYVLLLRRLILRGEWPLLGLLTMGLSVSALYLWTPQITPDQVWAMRRFVPVVMPATLVAATYALRRIHLWLAAGGLVSGRPFLGGTQPPGRRAPRLVAGVVAAVGVVLLIGVPLYVSSPVLGLRQQVPQRAQVAALCRAVGSNGAVLAIDDGLRYGYTQTIRSWCNVPAVGLVGATPSELATARRNAAAAGLTLYVMAATAGQGSYAGPPPKVPFSSTKVGMWPEVLNAPPQRARSQLIRVYLSTVTPDGLLVPVSR